MASTPSFSEDPQKAFTFAFTRVGGKPIIVIGLGNHDCVRYELTWSMVASFVLDAMKWVVRR